MTFVPIRPNLLSAIDRMPCVGAATNPAKRCARRLWSIIVDGDERIRAGANPLPDSVFAGFGLAIAAQLALEKNPDTNKRRIAIDLMRSSLLCILSFLFGSVYLMTAPLVWHGFLKALVVNASFFFLVLGTVYLVRSIGALAAIGFGLPKNWMVRFVARWTIGMVAAVAIFTAIVFLATFAGFW